MNANQIYLIFFLGTLILTIFSFFLILFLVHYKRRQQLFQKEKLMLEYQYQSQLLQTRLEVQEQSFQYFSEEIHDNIGQQFTICKLQLHQLQDYCKEDGFVLLQQTTDTLSKEKNKEEGENGQNNNIDSFSNVPAHLLAYQDLCL